MGAISSAINYKATQDTNDMNLHIAKMTNEANATLAQKQNEWNRKMWEDTNEYNTPLNQVSRFQEAGLSAAAAAQAAAGIPAQPMQSAELANQQMPAPQVAPRIDFNAESLLNIARQLEALKSDKLGNQMKEQDAAVHNRIILSEADAKQWLVDRMEQQYQQSASMFPYSIAGMTADTWYKQKMSDYYGEMRAKVEADTARVKQDFAFLEDFNELKKKELNEKINNILEERKKIKQDIATSRSQEGVNKSQQALNAALKDSAVAQKEQQELQNLLTTHGFPESVAMRAAVMLSEGKLDSKQFWHYLDNIKSYNHAGKLWFDNPETRQFLEEIYDEGMHERGKKGIWTMSPHSDYPRSFDLFKIFE